MIACRDSGKYAAMFLGLWRHRWPWPWGLSAHSEKETGTLWPGFQSPIPNPIPVAQKRQASTAIPQQRGVPTRWRILGRTPSRPSRTRAWPLLDGIAYPGLPSPCCRQLFDLAGDTTLNCMAVVVAVGGYCRPRVRSVHSSAHPLPRSVSRATKPGNYL